jgi:hypothetical protein
MNDNSLIQPKSAFILKRMYLQKNFYEAFQNMSSASSIGQTDSKTASILGLYRLYSSRWAATDFKQLKMASSVMLTSAPDLWTNFSGWGSCLFRKNMG